MNRMSIRRKKRMMRVALSNIARAIAEGRVRAQVCSIEKMIALEQLLPRTKNPEKEAVTNSDERAQSRCP